MKILNKQMLTEIQAGMRNESFASSRHPNAHTDRQAGPISEAVVAGLLVHAIIKGFEKLCEVLFPSNKTDKKDDQKKDAFSKGVGFNLSF